MKKGQPSPSFLQRDCSKKFHAKQGPSYLEFSFQVVDLQVYYESTPSPLLSGAFFETFQSSLQ